MKKNNKDRKDGTMGIGQVLGKDKELTCIWRYSRDHTAPMWSLQKCQTHWTRLQSPNYAAIRTAAECSLMSKVDHLQNEINIISVL